MGGGANGRAGNLVSSSNSFARECVLLAKGLEVEVPGEACLAWDNHPNLNPTSNSYLLGLPGVSPLLQPRYGPGTPVSSGYLTTLSFRLEKCGWSQDQRKGRPWVPP